MTKRTLPAFTFPDGLFLTFLGLKLAHAIGWSWWLVFAPLLWLLVALIIRERKGRRA